MSDTTENNPVSTHIDRDEAIKRIKAALKRRSGKSWSVTGDLPKYWDRFWSYVKICGDDDCWLWQGTILGKPPSGGYGRLKVGKLSLKAHRISYELVFGAIPDGLGVLHSCDNPPCVNPAHLFAGTNHQNVLDSVAKGRHFVGDPRPADRNGTSKLSWLDIDDIRIRAKAGENQRLIAASHRISQSSVSRIVNQVVWNDRHRSVAK
jgi:hypothetical protein